MIIINGKIQEPVRRKRYSNQFDYTRRPQGDGFTYGLVEGIYIGSLTCRFFIFFKNGEKPSGTFEVRRGEYNYSFFIEHEPTKRGIQILCAKLIKHVQGLPYCDNQ